MLIPGLLCGAMQVSRRAAASCDCAAATDIGDQGSQSCHGGMRQGRPHRHRDGHRSEGVARVVLLGDGTGALSVITSRRKAYTAAALGMTTEQLVKNLNGSNDLSMIDPELVALAGGIPILRHNVVIAALGVGGADRGDADVVSPKPGSMPSRISSTDS